MSRRLIVYGDIAIDVIVQAQTAPGAGHDACVDQVALLPGGSAANCAAVAGRLGIPVHFLGITGSDHLARLLIEDAHQHGVDTTHLRQTDGPTTIVVDIINPGGERTFYSARGAAATTAYGPIPTGLITGQDCLHISGYAFQDPCSEETAVRLMDRARQVGALISLDTSFHFARAFDSRFKTLVEQLDFIMPNADEARLMSGCSDPKEAAARIRALGPKTVVVKLGDQGCYLDSEQEQGLVAAYPVQSVVDTTGAGDAFCAGFLTAKLWGLDGVPAVKVGQAAAAHTITRSGGHTNTPDLDQLINFLEEHSDSALAEDLGEKAASN